MAEHSDATGIVTAKVRLHPGGMPQARRRNLVKPENKPFGKLVELLEAASVEFTPKYLN